MLLVVPAKSLLNLTERQGKLFTRITSANGEGGLLFLKALGGESETVVSADGVLTVVSFTNPGSFFVGHVEGSSLAL